MNDNKKNKKFNLEEYLIHINDKILELIDDESEERISLYLENRSKVIQLIEKNGVFLKNKKILEHQYCNIMNALVKKKSEAEHEILKNKKIQLNNRLYLKG